MVRVFIFIILSSIINNPAFSQDPSIINNFSKSVGLISFKDTSMIHSGTGTLILLPRDSVSGHLFLVTNKHVLPTTQKNRTDSIEFSIRKKTDNLDTFVKISIPIHILGFLNAQIKINDADDIAVILLDNYYEGYLEYLNAAEIPSYNLLATKQIISNYNITIGNEIFFIGYPSFLYNKRNISPVVRIGIISTDPGDKYYFSDILVSHGYQKLLNGFLIDGNSFGGSSGSLVFLRRNSIVMGSGRKMTVGDGLGVPFILGILTDSYLDIDERTITNYNNKKVYQKLNLGGVVAAEKIKDLIDSFKLH